MNNSPKVISSVCNSDEEVLRNVSHLFLNDKPFDLDPTYSKGNFYSNFPEPIYKFDLHPQSEEVVQANVLHLPLPNISIHSIVFDPPFCFGSHGKTKNNIMAKRFTMFDSFDELKQMYIGALQEFHRVLDKNGIVVFKCQDYTDSKTTLTHCLVHNWAIDCGFYVKDLFILIAKHRIFNGTLVQRHSRKFHSYYLVLEKRKK